MNLAGFICRAQNNSLSPDNVHPGWQLDWPKTSPTGHVDQSWFTVFNKAKLNKTIFHLTRLARYYGGNTK